MHMMVNMLINLQRNRCACCLSLNDHESALDAIQSALEQDHTSPHTHFLAFKLFLLMNNQERGTQSMLLLN